MDYGSVMKQAWEITRRSRVLKVLGVISAAQLIVYSLVVIAMLLPMTVLPQITMSISAAAQDAGSASAPFGEPGAALLADAGQALVAYLPVIVGGMFVLFCVWIVLGILDVAAQAGMIAEADGALRSRSADVRSRLRDGFGVWWRVVGLSAVAAMPALIMLLVIGLTSLFTYTLPLSRGEYPSPVAAVSAQMAMVPLQGIASVATVVLTVLVQIAMRSAVLEGLHWRQSLRRGFELAKANLVHVALTYFIATAIGAVVALGPSLAMGVGLGVVIAIVAPLLAVAPSAFAPVAIAFAALAVLALIALAMLLNALFIAWLSAVWTILWLRLTAPAEQPAPAVYVPSGPRSTLGVERS